MLTLKSHNVNGLPQFAQAQNSLEEQLELLRLVANRFGLYDAADYLKNRKPALLLQPQGKED